MVEEPIEEDAEAAEKSEKDAAEEEAEVEEEDEDKEKPKTKKVGSLYKLYNDYQMYLWIECPRLRILQSNLIGQVLSLFIFAHWCSFF